MRNGHYLIRHNLLGTEYNLEVYKGRHSLFLKESFLRNINADSIKKLYTVIKTFPPKSTKYDVAWWVDGKVKEIIPTNSSYSICLWMIKNFRQTTHRYGLLRPIKKP